jgi:hypothetical protein
MVTLIEIAVYAVVLSGGAPMVCMGHEHTSVTCSTGLSAEMVSQDIVRFADGTLVDRDLKGYPRFSNGIHSWFESSGWLGFSNGIEVRRYSPDLYKFNQGVECRTDLPNIVQCSRTALPAR